jgi:hypothetical protein
MGWPSVLSVMMARCTPLGTSTYRYWVSSEERAPMNTLLCCCVPVPPSVSRAARKEDANTQGGIAPS